MSEGRREGATRADVRARGRRVALHARHHAGSYERVAPLCDVPPAIQIHRSFVGKVGIVGSLGASPTHFEGLTLQPKIQVP